MVPRRPLVAEVRVSRYNIIIRVKTSLAKWDLVHFEFYMFNKRLCILFVYITAMKSMMCTNNRVHFGLDAVLVCLQNTRSQYHHYADSSEGIEYRKCLSGIFCQFNSATI